MPIGVLLSGCGVYDGAEAYDTVITLLALDRAGVEVRIMAPDVPQMHVVNHLTGQVLEGETRNVLVEAARLCRGDIEDVAGVFAAELDGLIIPGGFGAAKNLCDFASAGAECTVQPEVARLVVDLLTLKKPIWAICIAPALIAAILRDAKKTGRMTVGEGDGDGAVAAIQSMGCEHLDCPVEEYREDLELGLITTPAYMSAQRISEAAAGIEKLVARVLELSVR